MPSSSVNLTGGESAVPPPLPPRQRPSPNNHTTSPHPEDTPETTGSESKPNFQLAPSLLPFVLPLSKFAQLPTNKGKKIFVGVVVVRQLPDYEGGTAVEAEITEEDAAGGDGDVREVVGDERDGTERTSTKEDKAVERQIPNETQASAPASTSTPTLLPTPGQNSHTKPTSSSSRRVSSSSSCSFSSTSKGIPGAILVSRSDVHPPATATARPQLEPFTGAIDPSGTAWDIPTVECVFGTDQTPLESVARCVRQILGGEVKEMVRLLGSATIPIAVPAGLGSDLGSASEGEADGDRNPTTEAVTGIVEPQYGRRFDFLVKVHSRRRDRSHSGGEGEGEGKGEGKGKGKGEEGTVQTRTHQAEALTAQDGWKMKWVDTDEVWRVMKRLPMDWTVSGLGSGSSAAVTSSSS